MFAYLPRTLQQQDKAMIGTFTYNISAGDEKI
jgi:hypothetical protein